MECSFERDIDFTPRKKGKQEKSRGNTHDPEHASEKEAEDVLKHIHGYLNYAGGILILNNRDQKHSQIYIDKWIRMVIERLLLSIPESIVHNCVKIVPAKTRVQIYVRKSPEFVTKNYHLYTRGPGANTASVRGQSSCLNLLTYERPADVDIYNLCNDDISNAKCCEERTDVAEYCSREFKGWAKADNLTHKIKHDQVVGKCLSAFANLPDGGDFVAGIKEGEDSSSIKFVGYTLSDTQQQEISTSVADLFHTFKRLTGDVLKKNLDWTTDFIKLTKCQNHSDGRYLIHIRVNHVARGVFYGGYPESFISSENGSIRQLEVDEWDTLVNKEKGTCITNYNVQEGDCMGDKPGPSTPDDVPDTGDVIATDDTTEHMLNDAAGIPTEQQQPMSSFPKTVIDNIQKIFFRSGRVYIPPCKEVIGMADKLKMEKALLQINNMKPCTPSANILILTQKTWLEQTSTCQQTDIDSLCDIFVIANNGNASLTTIVGGAGTGEKYDRYSRLACRSLKQTFLTTCEDIEDRMAASKLKVRIEPRVYSLRDEIIRDVDSSDDEDLNNFITHVSTAFGRVDDEALIAKLLLTILTKHTKLLQEPYAASLIYDLPQKVLTKEQILSIVKFQIKPCAFTMITGPPGSGKTTMAMRLCRYFADQPYKMNVLFVTNRRGTQGLMENQGICPKILPKTEQDVEEICNAVSGFGCIILDDVQNMPPSDSWTRMFTTLRDRDEKCFTFMFEDTHFQMFNTEQQERQFNVTWNSFKNSFKKDSRVTHTDITLVDVHRISKVITSYIKSNLSTADNKHINPMSKVIGDAVSIRHTPDIMEPGPDNPLVCHLRDLLEGDLSSFLYVPSDIAVLVCGEPDQPDVVGTLITILRENGMEIYSVAKHTGIAVDMVVNFSGLETKVVLCIAPDKNAVDQLQENNNLRVFIASRARFRLDFLIPSPITTELLANMRMDRANIIKDSHSRYDTYPKHIVFFIYIQVNNLTPLATGRIRMRLRE